MPYTPIVGTLAYVLDRGDDSVLLVHRIAREDDDHHGLFNGLGGKLEADEDVVSGIVRELHEEATIEPTSITLRGTISWPGFGPQGEDWLGFVFLVDAWTGTPPPANAEGELLWVPRSRLLAACSGHRDDLPMWPGDRYFVPLVFDDDPRAFHGVMPYGWTREPTDWRYVRL